MLTGQGPSVDQQKQRDGHQSFVFLGGNLALDLVNTEIMVRGKPVDLLVTPRDATQWWAMARQAYPHLIQPLERGEWSEQQVAKLRKVRRTLRQMFECLAVEHQVDEEQVNALNRILREGYYALEVSPGGKVSAVYKTRQDPGMAVELSIAFAALSLLTEKDLNRLRACQNEKCMLLFYDSTRSATRHWCSIACMNRARSRKNYKQAKGAPLPSRDAS
jgi:predicted RNA-binding Zn ribbon-like protein